MHKEITVLIVEDDPDVLAASARIARSEGYQVMEATTGEACLKIARKNKPDLILLDVMLPDIQGTEICRQIKADPLLKTTFVVLTSGLKISSLEQAEGLDVGADGYIARPLSNVELKARINSTARFLRAERERDQLILELSEALSKVKQLTGLLPICMHCKKIRDDKGYWSQIETYIQKHSEAEFSHSICRECAETLYPDMNLYEL